MKNIKNTTDSGYSFQPGSLCTLRHRFILPDGKEYKGPPAMAACVLGPEPGAEGLLFRAAPVLPGKAMAMESDWVWDNPEPLGFVFRVAMPVAAAIPLWALGEYRGCIAPPPAAVTEGKPHSAKAGGFGLLEPDPGYFDEMEELKKEWKGLRSAAHHVRGWLEAGRIIAFPPPSQATRPPKARGNAVALPLAAASVPPWQGGPILCRHDFAEGRGTMAVAVERSHRILEVDLAKGLTLCSLKLDGKPVEMQGPDPWRAPLGDGPLAPMWVCLDTSQGEWFFRVEG